jgi:SRSO17 transposase
VDACTKRQVTVGRDGLPDRAVWRIINRACGAPPSSWYDLSNAPRRARLPLFVGCSGGRWALEPWYEDANTALGLEHDDVRQDPGWHQHMLVCL